MIAAQTLPSNKTYSWEKVQTTDPLWVDRIKQAVNAALTAKGLTPVESDGDVAVVAIETTQSQNTLNTFYDGFGGRWRGSSSDTLSDKSDKNIKNLDKGVQKMFDHFPPDVKK